jgi:ubiquitin carboxyl-terminal hydrolase 10
MREFPVIDSAVSLEQLRMRLKENELEQYGEPFTPDFVYDVIRRLPRFSTMRVSTVWLRLRRRICRLTFH